MSELNHPRPTGKNLKHMNNHKKRKVVCTSVPDLVVTLFSRYMTIEWLAYSVLTTFTNYMHLHENADDEDLGPSDKVIL